MLLLLLLFHAAASAVTVAGNFRRRENYILMMSVVGWRRDYSTSLMSSAVDSSIDLASVSLVRAHHPIMSQLMTTRYLLLDHTVSTASTIMPHQHPADVYSVIYPFSSLRVSSYFRRFSYRISHNLFTLCSAFVYFVASSFLFHFLYTSLLIRSLFIAHGMAEL